MSTMNQLRQAELQAKARACRLEMRRAAMGYRQAICPGADRTLIQRGEDGCFELGLALRCRRNAQVFERLAAGYTA